MISEQAASPHREPIGGWPAGRGQELRDGLAACPVCANELLVQEYRCRGCGIVLRGAFRRCELCALPEELLHFVGVFLEAEGNFRSVERRLGISYPTVKARLASVNARLAEARLRTDAESHEQAEPAAPRPPSPPDQDEREQTAGRGERLALLRQVRTGRLSGDDALRALQ